MSSPAKRLQDRLLIKGPIDHSNLPCTHSLSDDELNAAPDPLLIKLLKNGFSGALAVLFNRYHRLVLSVSSKILRDPGEAEDVMQEVFFEIYRKASLFDPEKGSAKIWILQYAYHRSMNRRQYLRLRGFYDPQAISMLNLKGSEPRYSPNSWGGLTVEERVRIMRRGMLSLSQKQRITLELAYFEGLLLKEIGERLDEPVERVSNYYYRGLKKLQDTVRDLIGTEKEQSQCGSRAS